MILEKFRKKQPSNLKFIEREIPIKSFNFGLKRER